MIDKETNINNLLNFNYQLRNIIDAKIENGVTNNNPTDLYMAYVLGKSYKTYSATIMLCENKFGEDACMLARTLFELMVICKYILKDKTGERLKRFIDFDWVTRKQMLSYFDDIQLQKLDNKTIKNIADNCDKAKKKWKYERGVWSDKSIEKMAEDIGRLDAYKTVYKLQCNLGHSNPRSINEYVKEECGNFIVGIEGGNNFIEESLVIIFDFMSNIAKEAYQIYDWEIGDLDKIINEYEIFVHNK